MELKDVFALYPQVEWDGRSTVYIIADLSGNKETVAACLYQQFVKSLPQPSGAFNQYAGINAVGISDVGFSPNVSSKYCGTKEAAQVYVSKGEAEADIEKFAEVFGQLVETLTTKKEAAYIADKWDAVDKLEGVKAYNNVQGQNVKLEFTFPTVIFEREAKAVKNAILKFVGAPLLAEEGKPEKGFALQSLSITLSHEQVGKLAGRWTEFVLAYRYAQEHAVSRH